MTTKAITFPLNPLAPLGLNSQSQGTILEPGWARIANNFIYGSTGELEVREGSQYLHTTAFSTLGTDIVLRDMYDYVDPSTGTSYIVGTIHTGGASSPTGKKLFQITSGVVSNISSTAHTGSYYIPNQFTTFNGKCIGLAGGYFIVKSGSGNFADVSLIGTAQPSTASYAMLSAFGRLWAIDGDDLKYSDLLDETAWNSSYDLSEYWGTGDDTGTALAEFNGHLVVFGKNNILVYDASQGPDSLVKVETISGVGCIARDSVQRVGDDIWFLSHGGLMSLSRTIIQKSMPVNAISKNVNDAIIDAIELIVATPSNLINTGIINGTYCPLKNLYILAIDTDGSGNSSGGIYAFDTRTRFEDGSYRVTTWSGSFSTSCLERGTGRLLLGGTRVVAGTYTAGVMYYGGYGGDYRVYSVGTGGTATSFDLATPWLDLSFIDSGLSTRTKILKTLSALIYCDDSITESGTPLIYLQWATDFSNNDSASLWTEKTSFTALDIDSYSKYRTPTNGSGKYISFSILGTGILNLVRLNSLNVQLKIGKDVV